MPILTAAFVLLLQADSGSGQGSAPLATSSNAFFEMVQNSGPIALSVLVLLLIASLYSWTVIFAKMSLFRKATNDSRRFVRAFRKATRLQEIAAIASDYSLSPPAQVFQDVYETYKRQTGGYGPPHNLVPLRSEEHTSELQSLTNLVCRL